MKLLAVKASPRTALVVLSYNHKRYMDKLTSVWKFSGPELEQNGLLCSSGRDANSHDPKLTCQALSEEPGQDAETGVSAVAQGGVTPVETESPPQQAGPSTRKALSTEDLSSRNSQEAQHWCNHTASRQTSAPSQSASDHNDTHSGDQQVRSLTEASERKQANNREHQRRWRLRHKARTLPDLH